MFLLPVQNYNIMYKDVLEKEQDVEMNTYIVHTVTV